MNSALLTRVEFDLLAATLERNAVLSQEELARITGHDLQRIGNVISDLLCKGLYSSSAGVTEAGFKAMEPYKVRRAVIIAAGFGSRMVPITLNTPKPLVRVNGKRMIDSALDALIAAGIEEIYIVRGYLGEQFDQLLYKYPTIRFVDNPSYNEANNVSSVVCVCDRLQNAYVMEADLIVHNPELIRKYHYTSNFLGIPVQKSDDWCFTVKDGIIQEQIVGGERHAEDAASALELYQEVGISYWNSEDGARLADHIKMMYEMPEGKKRYWDQAPMLVFADQYRVEIRSCKQEDIIEIDSFQELKSIDKAYDV